MLLITAAVTALICENFCFPSRKEITSGGCQFAHKVVKKKNMKAKLSKELNHKRRLGEMLVQLDNIYIPSSFPMIYSEHMVRS